MDRSQSHHQYASTGRVEPGRIDLNNYVPDPNKSNMLRSRLYDSGISNIPMPSVKRPIEEKISSKPFSARMNSSKIQSLSPLKKKIQDLNTAIIENLNQSYQYAAAQEAKYLGDGKAEIYRKQQVIIPSNPDLQTSVAGRKLQGRMGVSIGQPRMTGQLLNRKSQLQPLDPEFQEKVSHQLNKTNIMDPNRIMLGPPSLVYAGFEGGASLSQNNLEKARSKFLVDKLTGKLPQRPADMDSFLSEKIEEKTDKASKDLDPDVDKGEKAKKTQKKVQTWTDLDKYIELLLESRSEEETVFQYLNPSGTDNPYDLQVVVFGKRNPDKYYTLSGKGITQYNAQGPVEFLSLGQWLLERDSYKHIRELDFFKQFKKWKFMRMWKKNIKLRKRSNAASLLTEKLFCLQEHFHDALLKHRKLMLDMANRNTFVDTCIKNPESLKVEKFKELQEERQKVCRTEIEKQSAISRENIKDCIKKVIGELRDRVTNEIYLDESRKQQPNQNNAAANMKRNDTSEVFKKLEFPVGMTYGHRSQLRKECIKFLRFAYLVDFLSMEALAKIYTNSVDEMIKRMTKLDDCGTERVDMILNMDFDDSGPAANTAPRGFQPLFEIKVMLEDKKEIDPSKIKSVPIDDFNFRAPVVQDFDIIAHVEEEIIVEKEDGESDADEDDEANFVQKYRQIVPSIQEDWITLSPSKEEFVNLLNTTFNQGLQQIKCFTRWNKHPQLLDYSKVLEDWDWEDTVGDDWDTPDTDNLDPDSWINDNPIFKNKSEKVEKLLNNAFSKADMFTTRFQPLLEIYWRNKQFDANKLLLENLKNPTETLTMTLKLLKYYAEMFAKKLPGQTDIGLLQLQSKEIKALLLPTPKQIIEHIEKRIPAVNKDRLKACNDWLKSSLDMVKKPVGNVEEFVQLIIEVKKINEKFQSIRTSVDLIDSQNNTILNEKETGPKTGDKTEIANMTMAKKQINELTTALSQVESTEEQQKEKFKKELEKLIPELVKQCNTLKEQSSDPKFLDINSNETEMLKDLTEKFATYENLFQTAEKYNNWQGQLEITVTPFTIMDELYDLVFYRKLLWKSRIEWKQLTDDYKTQLFKDVNDKEISAKCDQYSKFCGQLERQLEPNEIQVQLKQLVDDYKGAMPVVVALKNPRLESDHWQSIRDTLGKPTFNPNDTEGYTLEMLIKENVVPFQDEIVAISTRATGEFKLKKEFEDVTAMFNDLTFNLVQYPQNEKYLQVIDIDKAYEIFDNLISGINMVLANRYAGKFRANAEKTKKEIMKLAEFFEDLMTMQKVWKYMERIFSSGGDIKTMLPKENTQFTNVCKFWEYCTTQVKKFNSKVLQRASKVGKDIKDNNVILEQINNSLQNLIKTKQKAFPRLFFLSDDEVLDVISSSDPEKVQGMLNKIFDGITRLKVTDQGYDTMISKEKEEIKFTKAVKNSGPVEGNLKNTEQQMKEDMSKAMLNGVKSYDTMERQVWVVNGIPGQVVATVAQIKWTADTEDAITNQANDVQSLENHYEVCKKQIDELAKLVANPNLESLKRHILVALITTDVHARDIVEDLKNGQIASTDDFLWKKQLRYYFNPEAPPQEAKNCKIEQVQATLMYGYEYMGATSRLVITPLTDRCWITISMALHIQRGANPAGPAGTGKTESTKDLAKAIALFCYVFNCSDQVDYRLVGKLFSGLCQQGCWACLDEFNRIDIEVLSVIAQQLLSIRNALLKLKNRTKIEGAADDAEGFNTFKFEDDEITIRAEFGCHITMNPGYAGRTELPDNLKILFRPVAMMVPSYQMIAEVMLGAEGFRNAKMLSHKMVMLYSLSSQQLSQQSHYDFGMRAVKSVLVMAGSLKRSNLEQPEDDVLIRAMKDANVPKFLQQDLPLFLAIVQDLFPTAVIQEPDYSEFMVQLESSIEKKGLQSDHKVFKQKVIQLHETFLVRFGVMLVGLTGSGKTRCFEVLADVMTALREKNHRDQVYQKVTFTVLNPKSISMGELYGEVDLASSEWSDGLASKLMREAAANPPKGFENDKYWTVFDGPVDALWIENMNTVLDDNMTLCLSNGQRIKLRPEMRMLFEVQDLAVASPATVSRCGMVYLTAEEMGWKPYVKSWIDEKYSKDEAILTKELREYLWYLFEQTVDPGLDRIRQGLKEPIKTNNLQQVKGLCAFLESFMTFEKGFKGDEKTKKKDLECLFAFSYTWGMGASLDPKGKDFFDTIVRDQFKMCQIPAPATVFDYFYDLRKEKCFKEWHTKVEPFVFDKTLPYFDLIVQTPDTYRHKYCLEQLLAVEKPCFFTGDSGVGKSVIVNSTLISLANKPEDKTMGVFINFSAQTNSGRTQTSMLSKMEKMRAYYAPPPTAARIAIFIDDINMPAVEEYGAQPPIELLRLFLNAKGVYQREDWSWKEVRKSTLVAGAAPPSGSRADLTPRFTTHFNMFCLPPANEAMLQKIFGSILEGFLKTGFSEKVQQLKDAVVNSTIEVYRRITSELRATPSKFHYTFNLRDVSKVFQGILMTKPVSIQTETQFTRLWVNETLRVFHDRLNTDSDVTYFIDLMMEMLNGFFKSGQNRDELFGESKVMFGDLLRLDVNRMYEEITNKDKLKKVLEGKLEDYNSGADQRMSLVFFSDAIHHILRICRALRQPRGNIMLIGVGGSGKQSLTKLSAAMYDIKYKVIEMKKDYKISDFRDFIKGIMFATAGIEREKKIPEPTVFTLTDSQIINETFLEDINNILNTGEIPNLMQNDDKEKITGDIREVVQEMKKIDTADVIQQVFIDRVRENFHICLCMSPVGDSLRIRCRQFPSLVNCCTLDWFSRWPAEALLYVSSEFLKDIEMPSEDIRRQMAEMCMLIHTSVETISEKFWEELRRRVYTTPKSYLDLIKLYIKQLKAKREEDIRNRDRLNTGLKKLVQTNENIAQLKKTLQEEQPKLDQKNKDLAVSVEASNKAKKIADEEAELIRGEAEIVEKQTAEATALQDECETELRGALPLMEAAKKAVDRVTAEAVTEIKSVLKPSENVEMVMCCIMLFLKKKPEWDEAKKEMQNGAQFLKTLKELRAEDIREKDLATIRKKYLDKKDKWDPKKIFSSSQAAANLAEWASAMSNYHKAWKIVEPKKAKLAEVQQVVKVATAELNKKMGALNVAKERVAALDKQVSDLNEDKKATEFKMKQASDRMGRAEKLVVMLKDEGVRWDEDCKKMNESIKRLVGNVFLASACISYFGAFTGDYRKTLTEGWIKECLNRKIPTSDTFSLPDVLGDPVVIRDWNLKGLPSDSTSAENGILATKAERWGLCIDPQQQANKWLTNMYKNMPEGGSKLVIMKGFENKNFLRELAGCVRRGDILLIEDITEELSPSIDPILLRQEFVSEEGLQIKLGDKVEDYDKNFKLFMTTKMANPEYKPEVCIKVTLINFTVTFQGLEEQLLGDVVIKEKPEVEQQRDKIVVQMAKDSATLKRIENLILKQLSESEVEEILDSDKLIDTLAESKITAGEINVRMTDAIVVTEQIANTRAMYKRVAVRGSILYFVVADMARINDMYQNSLQFVKVQFNNAIKASAQSDDTEVRLNNLIETITKTIFTNICRGLFERDKLIFSFLISTSINRHANIISPMGWSIMLRGANPFTEEQESKKPANPLPKLMTKLNYDIIYSAQLSIDSFAGIVQSMVDNEEAWTKWATSNEPHQEILPLDWETKLTDFQKLIVLKAFRQEKMMFAFRNYIITHLGNFFVESPSVKISSIYEDMNCETPLVFVLSTGADPTLALDKFAEEMGAKETMGVISLGQGQGGRATALIEKSMKQGSWALLQNCHLAASFMPELERRVLGLKNFGDKDENGNEPTDEEKETFKGFRLFLTSMPTDAFPVSVLQNSIKMTTEPPRGIKANIRRTYAEYSDQMLDECKKPEIFRRLLFGLAMFHAVSQERRKFGPLGFNNTYEFNDSDLDTSVQMLKMFLDEQEEIPWDSLNFMTGDINYGGRVTDAWDQRCLSETLKRFYCLENLEDGYFYDEENIYFCPPNGPLSVYKNYIESLPGIDSPSIFGLHANANISYQLQESSNMVQTVLDIQPRVSSSGGGLSPEAMVLERIAQLQAQIPDMLDRENGKKELFKQHGGLYASLTTVLLQEMDKFNRLINKIYRSLFDLKEAIGGLIVMSDVLDKMFIAIQNGQVPKNWEGVYPSLKPLASWYIDLNARVKFFQDWLTQGSPKSYWISGFIFPQGFTSGVFQTYSRHHKIAIDELEFDFEVLKAETPDDLDDAHVVNDGVLIHGFFVDGARWNREEQCIDDQFPAELYSTLPVLHLKPKVKGEVNKEDYACPCYKTGARRGTLSTTGLSTNMILTVMLPTSERHAPEVWVRRAAALLCQLSD